MFKQPQPLIEMWSFLGTVFGLFQLVAAGTGPSALYNALNGQTFNPPGYTIVMYQSCMQNQNAGNPCGSFTTFESSNGLYTTQIYGPATASGNCARTFRLSFACGPTVSMSGVNENPICVYSATMTHPYVCGLDMTVGNEAASVSPTALPPTSTPTTTLTLTATPSATVTSTATGTATTTLTLSATPTITSSTTVTLAPSATSTPLFVVTAFPTSTGTMTLTATSTPLYMITAWPTTSPVNVSATSTPLYYMTAYPSYNPNNSSGLGMVGEILASAPSSVATILGGVAVGIAGIGAIGFAVNHFRKGGTLKGLLQIAKSKEGEMKAMLPPSLQAKIDQAKADPRLQTALQIAEDPSKVTQLLPPNLQHLAESPIVQQLKQGVPPSVEQVVQSLPPSVQQLVQSLPPVVQQLTQGVPPSIQQVMQSLPPSVQQVAQSLSAHPAYSDAPFESVPQTLQQVVSVVSQNAPAVEPLAPQTATVELSAEHLEAFKAFLAAKTVPPTNLQ